MPVIRLSLSDNIVIMGYFLLVILIGLWFRRQQRSAEDYFAGNHQVPWWLAGISHYMSGFSAFTFVVYSEIAFRYGLVAILLFWTSVPACILGGWLFAARWRRARIITPVEFLEQRCNLKVRQLFAWSAIPAKVFEDSLKIFTTALFLSAGMGIGIGTAVLLCGAIVVLYTLLGGLLALVVTDYLQFLMKAMAILLLLPLAMWRLGGVLPTLHAIPVNLLHATNGPYGWVYLISYLVIVCISYNGNWAFAQKFYSVPDEISGKRAAYLSALLNFIGTPIMLLPAMIARKVLPQFAASSPPQDVYVHLVFGLLPAGMIGIIVAALFSATMATVSADLNAMAGVLTKDVYQRILRPAASEDRLVTIGRLATLLLGTCIVVLAIWIGQTRRESLFQTMVSAFGVLLAPTLLPLLSVLLFRKLSSSGVIAGFSAGLIAGITTYLGKSIYLGQYASQELDLRLTGYSVLINVSVTCAGMYLGSRLRPADPDEEARTTRFFHVLQEPIPVLHTGRTNDHDSPSNIAIGLSTLSLGILLITSGLLANSRTALWLDGIIGVCFLLWGAPSTWRWYAATRSQAQ